MVEIPTETLIDIAATLYAIAQRLFDFTGSPEEAVDTPTSTNFEMMADRLLLPLAARDHYPEQVSLEHPATVEAFARSEEILADLQEKRRDHRAAAARIRECGFAAANHYSDAQVWRERGGRMALVASEDAPMTRSEPDRALT